MKSFLQIVTIGLTLINTTISIAQDDAVTKDGKVVILDKDGTWHEKFVEQKTNTTCDNYIIDSSDKVTGKSNRELKDLIWVSKDGKKGLKIFLFEAYSEYDPSDKKIAFSIEVIGAGPCIEKTNRIDVLFRDGTRLSTENDGEFNCDAHFSLLFPKTISIGGSQIAKQKQKERLEMFRTKEIETMRVWTSKSFVEQDFSNEKSKILMLSVDCLMN